MKKLYILMLLIASTCLLSAQITLTKSSSIPQVGDVFSYTQGSDLPREYEKEGANQTWDFSSLTGTQIQVEYISLGNSLLPNKYTDTDIVEKTTYADYVSETYYNTSGSSLNMNCNYIEDIMEVSYENKREVVSFPITYNDVFNETFSGTVLNQFAQSLSRAGNIEIKADAYGNIILPYATINNVLRVRAVLNYSDDFQGIPFYNYVDTIYMWYNNTTRNFIASVSVAYANGSPYTASATYINQSSLNTDVKQNKMSKPEVAFYPNPAKEYIILNTPIENIVNIYDIKGNLVKTFVGSNGDMINITELNPGIYLLKYMKGTDLSVKKLIIE